MATDTSKNVVKKWKCLVSTESNNPNGGMAQERPLCRDSNRRNSVARAKVRLNVCRVVSNTCTPHALSYTRSTCVCVPTKDNDIQNTCTLDNEDILNESMSRLNTRISNGKFPNEWKWQTLNVYLSKHTHTHEYVMILTRKRGSVDSFA